MIWKWLLQLHALWPHFFEGRRWRKKWGRRLAGGLKIIAFSFWSGRKHIPRNFPKTSSCTSLAIESPHEQLLHTGEISHPHPPVSYCQVSKEEYSWEWCLGLALILSFSYSHLTPYMWLEWFPSKIHLGSLLKISSLHSVSEFIW